MSVAVMTDLKNIDGYYKHGYAFVTDTTVDYDITMIIQKLQLYILN